MADINELKNKSLKLLHNAEDSTMILNSNIQLLLLKQSIPTDLEATFYEPALCLILQGKKEVTAGPRSLTFGAGELLVISHEIPVVSRVIEASAHMPYIALILRLDINIIRGLHEELADIDVNRGHARSLEVNEATAHIIDSLFRLLNASREAADSIVLLPQILREVHFRLLQAPSGGMLRNLLRANSHASKISKAISLIRCNFREPLAVSEVARSVGMSVSSFFHHFKAITESTPLQYQKNIRLLEARRLLINQGEPVTLAALQVGYESPSQFSREYVRKFGSTPSDDLKTRGRGQLSAVSSLSA